MNKLTLSGTIVSIGQTEQVSEKFSKREVVLDVKNGSYTDKVCLQFVKDRTDLLDPYKPGDEVHIHFNPNSREWNGKWFTNLTAWGIGRGLEGAVNIPEFDLPPGSPDPLPF